MGKNRTINKEMQSVSIQDIDDFEFAGLFIDEKTDTGYKLFVPHSLHKEIFESIDSSTRLMRETIERKEKFRISLENHGETTNTLKESIELQISKMKEELNLLIAIYSLSREV